MDNNNNNIEAMQEIQRQKDRAERESRRLEKQRELEEILRKQKEIEDEITEDEIQAYDNFMKILGEESVAEAFSRTKPNLPDITIDATGQQISYERSPVRKPPDVPLALTEDHILEINYCFQHPIYMIKNYIKIINQDLGLMNFVVYPYQAEFIKNCFRNKRMISCWSRQSGKCECSNVIINYIKKPTSFLKRLALYIILKIKPNFIDITTID